MVKNPPANAGETGNAGSIPGSGRSPGGGQGNPLQFSCLENPMDRGAWRAIVHRVTKSWTRLKQFSMHTCMLSGITSSPLTHTYRDPLWPHTVRVTSSQEGRLGSPLERLGFFFFFLAAFHGLQDLSPLTRS